MSSPETTTVFVSVISALALNGLFTAALVAWGRSVARRQGGAWGKVAWTPLVGFVANTLGLLLTIAALLDTFDAVASVPAEQKARLLSDGIAHAMRATAILGPIAALAYAGSIVAFLAGTFRRPGAAAPAPR